MKYGLGGLGMGCRRSAITVIIFFNAIMAAVSGVAAAVFLIWIDPSLTLLILVSAGLAALLLYPLTLLSVHVAKDRENPSGLRKEVCGLGRRSQSKPQRIFVNWRVGTRLFDAAGVSPNHFRHQSHHDQYRARGLLHGKRGACRWNNGRLRRLYRRLRTTFWRRATHSEPLPASAATIPKLFATLVTKDMQRIDEKA
jgi:hypothetical protein